VCPGVVKNILNAESKIDLFSVPRFGILHLVLNPFVNPHVFGGNPESMALGWI
jgi:hypothetical protein